MATNDSPAWNARFYDASPIFWPLRAIASDFSKSGDDWPSVEDFNRSRGDWGSAILSGAGASLRFVHQSPETKARNYDAAIYETGHVSTRPQCWHDYLNMLVWRTFPQTKAVVNERQYRAHSRRTAAGERTPEENMLTHFDECGVVVVSASRELLELLESFRWKELFWERRDETSRAMEFIVFGHGLYEKCLRPYVGLTGQGLLNEVDAGYFSLQASERLRFVDERVAALLRERAELSARTDLSPVPLLGVPGYCPANEEPQYYDNERYFRAGRSARTS